MKRIVLTMIACALLSACTTTQTCLADDAAAPKSGATILVVRPDVTLSILTAAGSLENRADWTKEGTGHLSRAVEQKLAGKSHKIVTFDPDAALDGRQGQILRLNDAVSQSIAAYGYVMPLPTKGKRFEWTLGPGAAAIDPKGQADYALFIIGRGVYASGGRIATAVALSMVGVGVPMGSQEVRASLVDLKTGKVVWYNVAISSSGANADMRQADGAERLITAVLKNAPL